MKLKQPAISRENLICTWLSPKTSPASCLTAHPDGTLLVGRENSSIDILSQETFSLVRRLYGPPASNFRNILLLSERPFKNRYFVSTGLDGNINLWSLDLGRTVANSPSYGGAIFDSVLQSGTRSLLVACEDGAVREFSLEFADDISGFNPILVPVQIVFKRIIVNERNSGQILSLCLRENELFVGTSNSEVFKWDLKSSSAVHRISLSQRAAEVVPPAKKMKTLDDEEKTNVFLKLDEEEKLAGSCEPLKETLRLGIRRLTYSPTDDAVICACSDGAVVFVDPGPCTILTEFHKHDSAVTDVISVRGAEAAIEGRNSLEDNDVCISVGVDGRLVTYVPSGQIGMDTTIMRGPSAVVRKAGVVRYAHEVEATAIALLSNGAIAVSGSDGCLSVFQQGLASIRELGETPTRVVPTCLLRGGSKLGSSADLHPKRRVMLEVFDDRLRVWSFAPSITSEADLQKILQEARNSLKLPETKAMNRLHPDSSSVDDVSRQHSTSLGRAWIPVKLAEICFTHPDMVERVVDGCFLEPSENAKSQSDEVLLAALTDRNLRLFTLDLKKVNIETFRKPKTDLVSLNSDKSLKYLNVFSLGLRPKIFALSFAKLLGNDGKPSFGFLIMSLHHQKPLCQIEDLPFPVSQISLPDPLQETSRMLLVDLCNGSVVFFETDKEQSGTSAWRHLKYTHQISPLTQGSHKMRKLAYHTDTSLLFGLYDGGLLFVYDLVEKSYLNDSSNSSNCHQIPPDAIQHKNDSFTRECLMPHVVGLNLISFKNSKASLLGVFEGIMLELEVEIIVPVDGSQRQFKVSYQAASDEICRLSIDESITGVEVLPNEQEWDSFLDASRQGFIFFVNNKSSWENLGPPPLALRRYHAS